MATLKGDNRTAMDTATPATRLKPGQYDGRVKVMTDTYTADAADPADVIQMCGKLPKGAIVLDVILSTDDLGTTTQLEVGDALDPDRYIVSATNVADNQVTHTNRTAGRNYEVLEAVAATLDSQILVTVSIEAASGLIKLTVLYTHD